MQRQERKSEKEKEKERGVAIKCKSITHRKQLGLAQVERKLEKSWQTTHSDTHTQRCICKNTSVHVHTHMV